MDQIPGEPFHTNVETIETARPSRWRMIAATATGSVALLGVAAGIGYAAAGSSAGASSADATTTTTAPANKQQNDQQRQQRQTDRLKSVLQPLVDKGTINAAQRDAVIAALEAAGPKGGGFGGHGGPGGMIRGAIGLFGADADAAAKAIGITTDELKKDVLGGQSLADVATAHHVSPDAVIKALVDATKAQLAQHPRPNGATGPTDAEITQRITDLVNGKLPAMGFGRGGHGPRGGWGGPDAQGAPGAPAAPATPATPPTTAGSGDSTTTTAPATTSTEPATTTTTS